jgi:hypothetical protein
MLYRYFVFSFTSCIFLCLFPVFSLHLLVILAFLPYVILYLCFYVFLYPSLFHFLLSFCVPLLLYSFLTTFLESLQPVLLFWERNIR